MTQWIGDTALAHLRDVADWPDLGDRYEITGRVGRGGMGSVYTAVDRTLSREVAVKVLGSARSDPEAASRLLSEARILARLEHPGIVPVHDAGVLADGRVFYVMKLVRGQRLSEAIPPEASISHRLELFLRICDAVSFAHAHGIVHGDLKPENIMLGSFGEVLVLDWGVAAVLSRSTDHPVIAGTPGFMPPEQAAGEPTVDARADVYALGALLEAMLPAPLARPLAAVARRARAVRPDARYGGVAALADDIGRFRDGESVNAYRENLWERSGRFYQRYRVPILLVVAYMIMRLVLLWWVQV
jgi:eukaryotic-like serine/threonine-protein kinase